MPRGWVPGRVSVGCDVTDDGSGVRKGEELVVVRATEPPGDASAKLAFPRERVCDNVGNCTLTPRLAFARVDRQPPVVTCAKPAPGSHDANLSIACVASDGAGSGLADPTEQELFLTTNVAAGTSETGVFTSKQVVCDRVGNCTTAGPIGPIAIDLKEPASRSAAALPSSITVLAAEPHSAQLPTAPGAGAVAVPYDEPGLGGASALAAQCSPAPGTPLPLGATTLVCGVPAANGKFSMSCTIALEVTGAADLALR